MTNPPLEITQGPPCTMATDTSVELDDKEKVEAYSDN